MPDSTKFVAASLGARDGVPHVQPVELTGMVRQPILDLRGRLHGYELLFQDAPEGDIGADSVLSPLSILDNMVLFGLDLLTGGTLAFVRCTAEALSENLLAVLPPSLTVLEIPAALELTPKLLEACREFSKRGFRLALIDFKESETRHPLLDIVQYIKVNSTCLDICNLETLRRQLKGRSTAIVAEEVHTQDAYMRARAGGCSYFQGFYFCNPETVRNAKVPANRLLHIEILRQLFRDPLDLGTLCPLLLRDAALVYRVLRLVNSPTYAIRHQVSSIQSAVMILGDDAVRGIATLAIQCALNAEQPPELLHMALLRARFCAEAAHLCNLHSNEQYLLGMLSLLPAMLRVPMETLAPQLPLRKEIRQALLGAVTPERCLLAWIESHECNKVSGCLAIADTYGLDRSSLMQIYFDAVVWVAAQPDLVA
jgi:EAL and modified HD-GYP domain-containing signal transduction protein